MKALENLRVIEFAGLGPGPFAAMTLADMGVHVTRITRPGPARPNPAAGAFLDRGRTDLPLDLKSPDGREAARALIQQADAVIEGFRPGKMESLGLGPDDLMPLNPRLVYGRMTGWGQTGPMAHLAGHDLNYLGLTGMLSLMGDKDRPPTPPLNLVSDFGGGGMYLVFGLICAMWQAQVTGQGQVVDAAMIHGTTHLASFVHGRMAQGAWVDGRGNNALDGGAPFYRTYETRDGRYMAVAGIEPVFFANMIRTLGLDERFIAGQGDRTLWPELTEVLRQTFLTRDFADWVAVFADVDACVTPVLTVEEARSHPQMEGCFVAADGHLQPSPAPRMAPWTPKS